MVDTEKRRYNSRVEEFREREYPMLKGTFIYLQSWCVDMLTTKPGSIYLDHAGSTIYSKSLIERFSTEMMSNLLGNPHSASSPSQFTTSRIENIRLKLLKFFNADPDEFDLVFVANATAGIKLVSEAFRALPEGFSYVYHQACHTSIIGVREEARGISYGWSALSLDMAISITAITYYITDADIHALGCGFIGCDDPFRYE
ncbi:molybdenum cofactor sulfurase [Colletotrichum tofieldiae]|nr:molybdenum cofactor sulfurase [Colletotrichum tofieldiae]